MFRVVIGVDGSPESLRAVTWVAQLAGKVRELQAITVAVYGLEQQTMPYGTAYISDGFLEEWRADLQRHLESDWTKPLRDAGVQPSIRAEEGLPGDVLARLATENHADLIVVGSRGRGHLRACSSAASAMRWRSMRRARL